MPRTTDHQAHALRRDEFLDAAQRLIQARGYERMSIQDVLDETGASRGAFYHYFDSKDALLQALVDRMADVVAADLATVVEADGRTAVAKLQAFYSTAGAWKVARRDLLMALLGIWFSDENALLRDRLNRGSYERLAPILERIIWQGCEEGTFRVTDARETARLIVALIQGMGPPLGDLVLAEPRDGTLEAARRLMATYNEAIERILGLTPGSVEMVDEDTLRVWFASGRETRA